MNHFVMAAAGVRIRTGFSSERPLIYTALFAFSLVMSLGCRSDGSKTGGPGQAASGLDHEVAGQRVLFDHGRRRQSASTEHADQYDLIVNGIKDERDLSRQVALVEEMVASGVDAIVIAPADSKALVPALAAGQASRRRRRQHRQSTGRRSASAEKASRFPSSVPTIKRGRRRSATILAAKLDARATRSRSWKEFARPSTVSSGDAGFEEAMKDAGIDSRRQPVGRMGNEQGQHDRLVDAERTSGNQGDPGRQRQHGAGRGRGGQDRPVGAAKSRSSASTTSRPFNRRSAKAKFLATADQHGDQLAVFGIEAALKMLDDPTPHVEDVETPVDLVTARDTSHRMISHTTLRLLTSAD